MMGLFSSTVQTHHPYTLTDPGLAPASKKTAPCACTAFPENILVFFFLQLGLLKWVAGRPPRSSASSAASMGTYEPSGMMSGGAAWVYTVCLASTLVLPRSRPLYCACNPGLVLVALPCPWHARLSPASSAHNQHSDILMLMGTAHVCLAYNPPSHAADAYTLLLSHLNVIHPPPDA